MTASISILLHSWLFVDTSEWQDTSYAFIKDDLMTFTNNFQFTRTQMHADSLIFRINTDCNDNNSWDQAEQGIADYNNDGDMKDILFAEVLCKRWRVMRDREEHVLWTIEHVLWSIEYVLCSIEHVL